MNDQTLSVLMWTAASIAFLHTIIGVDHYLPFVVIGRARKWSLGRILSLAALCGVGHVLGSVLLGFVGIGIGVAIDRLELIEGARGSMAAWGLIAFGLVYATWSFWRARREDAHVHDDGTVHTHDHHGDHSHEHSDKTGKTGMTGWALFVLFVFGPCEVLIPMFMAPAYERAWWAVAAVAFVFGAVTIITMVGAVALGVLGLKLIPVPKGLEKYSGTIAGVAIASSGLLIQVAGI